MGMAFAIQIVKLQLRIETISGALQSSSDVSALLLNQPAVVKKTKKKAEMFEDGVPVVIPHHASILSCA